MKSFEITIFVEPVPKGRARVAVINGYAHGFTPKKTKDAETEIINAIREQVGDSEVFAKGVPLRLSTTFYRTRPKHLAKGITMPVSKPDVDNYGKLLLDALNHCLLADDSQITSLVLKKRYVEQGKQPRIDLSVREDD